MTRRTPPAITVDRHMTLGNRLKDVFEEPIDIMDNSGAKDLIVRRTPNAVVATNRLKVALEHDLHTLVSIEQDSRFILEQADGDGRFAYDCTQPEPDAFANWHEIQWQTSSTTPASTSRSASPCYRCIFTMSARVNVCVPVRGRSAGSRPSIRSAAW